QLEGGNYNIQKESTLHLLLWLGGGMEGQPSVIDFGFVTFSLSRKWMAEMLQDGLDTWAPKLPVKRVLVEYPCHMGSDETEMDTFRRSAITNTLFRMLNCSKVHANMSLSDGEVPV
ncbi:hypothetical protein Tco_0241261, partial [Tanacetum coccineum]